MGFCFNVVSISYLKIMFEVNSESKQREEHAFTDLAAKAKRDVQQLIFRLATNGKQDVQCSVEFTYFDLRYDPLNIEELRHLNIWKMARTVKGSKFEQTSNSFAITFNYLIKISIVLAIFSMLVLGDECSLSSAERDEAEIDINQMKNKHKTRIKETRNKFY